MTYTLLWQSLGAFILFLTYLALWRIVEADDARQQTMDEEHHAIMQDYEQRLRRFGRHE